MNFDLIKKFKFTRWNLDVTNLIDSFVCQNLVGIVSIFLMSGCGSMVSSIMQLESSLPNQELINLSGIISVGDVNTVKVYSIKSNVSTARCEELVQLYSFVDYLKHKKDSAIAPLAVTSVNDDKSFSFVGVKAKGFGKINSLGESYVLVFKSSNCIDEIVRCADSEKDQVISEASSRIFDIISQSVVDQYSGDANTDVPVGQLPEFKPSFLSAIYNKISPGTTPEQVNSLLESSIDLQHDISNIVNKEYSQIIAAPPVVFGLILPAAIAEKQSYSITRGKVVDWKNGSSFVEEWSVDNVVIGNLSAFSFVTTADSQGSHVVKLQVGSDDGHGKIDSSKPRASLEATLNVQNTFPAQPPKIEGSVNDLSLVTEKLIHMSSVEIQMNNGPEQEGRFSGCETFSKFTYTINNIIQPLLASQFSETCSSSSQKIAFSFQEEGVYTLRFWSIDSAFQVSSKPAILKYIFDNTPPLLDYVVPSVVRGQTESKLSVSMNDLVSGIKNFKAEFSADGVEFTSVFEKSYGTSVSSIDEIVAVSWPAVDTQKAVLRFSVEDYAGNRSSQVSNYFSIDSTNPSIVLANPNGGIYSGGSIVNIQWVGADDNLLALPVKISFSMDNGLNWSEVTTSTNIGSYFWSVPFVNTSQGLIRVAIEDSVGHQNLVISASTFIVDSVLPEKPKVILTTPLEDSSTVLTFQNLDCDDKTHLVVRENSTPPLISDSDWKICATSETALSYELESQAMGYRPLYIWAKDGAGHISPKKTIPFTYAPKVILGTDNADVMAGFLGGMSNPNKIFFFENRMFATDLCRVLAWNNLPSVNHQSQDFSLGTPLNDYSSCNHNGVTSTSVNGPTGLFTDGNVFIIGDSDNNRVLIYDHLPTSTGDLPDVVLGQIDFESASPNFEGITARTLNGPTGVGVYDGKLYVADSFNNRVLIWNSIPTSNAQPADIVLGQPSFNVGTRNTGGISAQSFSFPRSFSFSSGKLYLADAENNRILIWNTVPSVNHAPADIVLGQPNMISNAVNFGGGASANTLNNPRNVFTNGNKLVVADGDNNRVLIWNSIPIANQQAADVVVGQSTFSAISANQGGIPGASTLNLPVDAVIDNSGQLWITEYYNNRVVRFSTVPTTNGASADLVLGQSALSNQISAYSPVVTANSYRNPNMIQVHNQALFVLDAGNARLLRYGALPLTNSVSPVEVFGQSDFVSGLINRGQLTPTPDSLNDPRSFLFVGSHAYIADGVNHRILGWNNFNNSFSNSPDFVLGQPDFTAKTANNGGISASSAYVPNRIWSDGTRFVVSDTFNNRILIWNSLPTSTKQAADIVLGQPDMNSNAVNSGGLSARSLFKPQWIAGFNGVLAVGDTENNRVLVWKTFPTQNFQAADVVIGQKDFVSNEKNAFGFNSLASLYRPYGVKFLDDGKLLVSTGNDATGFRWSSQIKIWNQVPEVNGAEADQVVGGYSIKSGVYSNGSPSIGTLKYSGLILSIESDGERLIVGNGVYGDRGVIFRLPEVSLTSGWLSSSPNVNVTIHNCYSYSKVIVSEGSKPAENDPRWIDCTTEKNAISFAVNNLQGYHLLKVWFKDEDGLVLPQYRPLDFVLDQTGPGKPWVQMASLSVNNSAVTIKANTCNDAEYIFISESSTPPDQNSPNWQACSTTNMSYNMSDLSEGTHTLYIWSRDVAGNISSSYASATVIIDTTSPQMAPTAKITKQLIATFSNVSFTMDDCSDAGWVIANEGSRPAATDAGWVVCSTTQNLMSLDMLYPTSGLHTFNIWSKDSAGNVSLSPSTISKNYDAQLVLGQVNFSQVASAHMGLSNPRGIDSDGTHFAVVDQYNGRILIWNSIPTTYGVAADVILGQVDSQTIGALSPLNGNIAGVSASNFFSPTGVLFVSGKLVVSDSSSHRVLIWNSIPTSNAQPADVVLGQPNMTSASSNNGGLSAKSLSGPSGLASDGTNLVVSDRGNNRLLIWNTVPSSNQAPADIVLGQPNMTSNIANNGGVSARSLSSPYDIRIRGGKLFVPDYNNNRVLIWNSVPVVNQAAADWVLGQASFTSNASGTTASSFKNPFSVDLLDTQIYVSDYNNHRVLIWDNIPTSQGQAANRVLGVSNFTTVGGGCSSFYLSNPANISIVGSSVFVSVGGCNAVSVWSVAPTANAQVANWYLGNTNPNFNNYAATPNLLSTYDGLSFGLPIETSFSDDGKMFVSDLNGNRILGWNSIPTSNNQTADFVLGQPNLTANTARNSTVTNAAYLFAPWGVYAGHGKFLIADTSDNRVLLYNSTPSTSGQTADLVLGQINFSGLTVNRGTGVSSNTLNSPRSSFYDGVHLFVADSSNHRVLIWNSFPTTSGQAADVVLGQADFVSGASNRGGASPTASTLSNPYNVYSDGTRVFVSDYSNNRLLIWNSIPTVNGQAADVVIGQSSFLTATAGTSLTGLNGPRAVVIQSERLFIVDQGNSRIVYLNTVPIKNGVMFDGILGQKSSNVGWILPYGLSPWVFFNPSSIATDPSGSSLWITDQKNHRVLKVNVEL